jgi:hypothetical protein
MKSRWERDSPDRPYRPPSVLHSVYRVITGGKVAHPTPSSGEVKEIAEPYIYALSVPSSRVTGSILPYYSVGNLIFRFPDQSATSFRDFDLLCLRIIYRIVNIVYIWDCLLKWIGPWRYLYDSIRQGSATYGTRAKRDTRKNFQWHVE